MKKPSYLFIVNPVAGNHKGKRTIGLIEELLEKHEIEYRIEYTTHKGSVLDLLRNVKETNFDVVVAVGGDGTVNEVINSMVGVDKAVGIIPCGTGNDLAKSLCIPQDPIAALEVLISCGTVNIDIGQADHQYFTNVASIGLDAEIAYSANKIKKKFSGTKAYLLALLKVLFSFKSFSIELEHQGNLLKKEVMLVAVCNGKYYGGGMKIAPEANISDGMLDVCLIEKMSKLKLLFLFPTVYKGTHNEYKEVKFFKTNKLSIKSASLLLNLDGEIFERDDDVEFSVIQNHIKMILDSSKVEVFKKQIEPSLIKAPAS